MDTAPPVPSGDRWSWSAARLVRAQMGLVVVIPRRSLRAAVSYAAQNPRLRGIVGGLLRRTPRLRLRIKLLVMAGQRDRAQPWRAFGPPAVVRRSTRAGAASAESASSTPSTRPATRFAIAEWMQPTLDVEDVRARLQQPK